MHESARAELRTFFSRHFNVEKNVEKFLFAREPRKCGFDEGCDSIGCFHLESHELSPFESLCLKHLAELYHQSIEKSSTGKAVFISIYMG